MKAEVFSTDFIAGLTIFLLVIVLFESFYINLESEIGSYKLRNEAQTKSNNIADSLVTGSGYPSNWNNDTVEVIGLFESGMISLNKFSELKKIEYYTAKRMMGVGGYEIYLEVTNSTGDMLDDYHYGVKENENSSQVFYVKRLCLVSLDGNVTKAVLNVGVWS